MRIERLRRHESKGGAGCIPARLPAPRGHFRKIKETNLVKTNL